MKINKTQLTHKIGQMVAEQLLKEYADMAQATAVTPKGLEIFTQLRALKVAIQQALLDFETEIRDELGLKDLNSMDPLSQKTYSESMDIMHAEVIEAVKKAVLTVKSLPKEQEEAPAPAAGGGAPAPQVKLNVAK